MGKNESNKIIHEQNKNGIRFCKVRLLESEIVDMSSKLKEKDSKISELERLLTDLSEKMIKQNQRDLKSSNSSSSESKSDIYLDAKPPKIPQRKTYADKSVQVQESTRKPREIQCKLKVLELRINETTKLIEEKDAKIGELEKSVEELNRRMRLAAMNNFKKEKGKWEKKIHTINSLNV